MATCPKISCSEPLGIYCIGIGTSWRQLRCWHSPGSGLQLPSDRAAARAAPPAQGLLRTPAAASGTCHQSCACLSCRPAADPASSQILYSGRTSDMQIFSRASNKPCMHVVPAIVRSVLVMACPSNLDVKGARGMASCCQPAQACQLDVTVIVRRKRV